MGPSPSGTKVKPIGTLALKTQEQLIMDDLLSVLMGLEGNYIDMADLGREEGGMGMGEGEGIGDGTEDEGDLRRVVYYLDETLHPSLAELASRILPMASDYVYIRSFIDSRSKFEYGYVCHALCAAIRDLLTDYLTLLTQLEQAFRRSGDTFTLHRFWSAIAPSAPSLETLARLSRDVVRAASRSVSSMGILGGGDDPGILGPEETIHPYTTDPTASVISLSTASAMVGDTGKGAVPVNGKGGAILGLLADGMSRLGGGPVSRRMYELLLSKAATPWVEILRGWVIRGEVRDPYEEFMVRERSDFRKERLLQDFTDEYWEKRYVLAGGSAIPRFLRPVQGKILLAGKYLNVLREYGRDVSGDLEGRIRAMLGSDEPHEGKRLIEEDPAALEIEISYTYANRTLLDVLLQEQRLLGRLRSIKRYFLLDQADYLTHFLDLAKEDLRLPVREVPLSKLQRLLELVLRAPGSVSAADPFKEEVRACLERKRLVDGLLHIINREGMPDRAGASSLADISRLDSGMTTTGTISLAGVDETVGGILGIEAFSLDYRVPFPLSLVISRRSITKYQLLFRHLLQVKYVERLLCAAWTEHSQGLAWRREDRQGWNHRAFALRSRMLWFVQQFAFYVGIEVIEPSWQSFTRGLAKVTTVDQLMQLHLDYVDTCLKNCMLTNARLLKTYNKIIQNCVHMAIYVEQYSRKVSPPVHSPDEQVALSQRFLTQQEELLDRFERRFDTYLRRFVEDLNFCTTAETPQFTCLLVRLEYNLNWRRGHGGGGRGGGGGVSVEDGSSSASSLGGGK
ncbi:MAG: gamma-tubulin complex component protein [Piptocephalis tieghemiana]|nr:MAG: gamma-tubulin complex component protein [Piptocephalis tieghemiana]